jgi:(2Fe-2S) ferredoxin
MVQIIKTGCTDHCKRGPVIAVMPRNEWNFEVSEEKAMSLLEQFTVTS